MNTTIQTNGMTSLNVKYDNVAKIYNAASILVSVTSTGMVGGFIQDDLYFEIENQLGLDEFALEYEN